MATTGVALRLEGINKRYGAVTALEGLDLSIKRGEFFTLLGPSGSGKSTTLMLIAGFQEPTSGELYLDDRPLSRIPAHKRQIGVVFQSYALFPHLTIFENVAFALRNLRWAEAEIRAQVGEMLSLVQLEGYEKRLPGQLSGGQQQRVALARSLAFRPSVLLLDEPIGALDRKLREHMLIEFKRIHRVLGTTMVYVTHDQEEALVMSDRIGVMNQGRLVRVGTPRELYEDPRDPFVAEFLGETNLLPGEIKPSGGVLLEGATKEVQGGLGAPAGSKVTLVLRPEKIAMSGEGQDLADWNSICGKVEEVIYVGEATKYCVRTTAGHVIRVKQLNRRLAPAHDVGKDVTLYWHEADGHLLEVQKP
jgi:spermidine/putrescine ABC transporter ATP-binding subunit